MSKAMWVLGSLGVAGYLCGLVGQQLPPGRWRTWLLIAAHILPGDVTSAWKRGTAAIAFGLLCFVAPGCNDAATIAAQQTAVATYLAEQEQCVALAGTRLQAEDCRAGVKETWCGPRGVLYEAGACNYDGGRGTAAYPSDGGAQ